MSAPPRKPGGLYGGILATNATSSAPESSTHAVPVPTAIAVPDNASTVDASAKPAAARSAALAFAPTRRAPAAKATKPIAPRLPINVLDGATTSASAVIFAEPALNIPPSGGQIHGSAPVTAGAIAPGWGGARKMKPPSMVLDVDVNGFGGGNQNKKKGHGKSSKKSKRPLVPAHNWDPDEPYDPLRPNDYNDFKAWRERQREEERRLRQQERWRNSERKRQRSRSGSRASSEYSDEEERPYKEARYENDPSRRSTHAPPDPTPAPSNVPTFAEDGEAAYLRRLAMSTRPAAASAAPPPEIAQPPVAAAPAPVANSGEEAYLRRLALSQGIPPPAAAPAYVPPPDDEPAYISVSPPAEAPSAPPTLSAEAKARRDAAAAIAARLAALAPGIGAAAVPPPSTQAAGPSTSSQDIPMEPPERNNHDFAQRMMAKWGHQAGQGLGADASGIIEPLTVQRAKAAKASKGGPSSQQAQPAAVGGIGVREGSKTARIVNRNDRDSSDMIRYGEPSTIVVLSNMVGLEDADDEDLQGEIGDECGKYGVVTRVLIHVVNPIPADRDKAVRIFVQFSGPAGAWKTVRELDGRFFGGRTVHARYFPEAMFAQHLLDGPLP